MPEMEKSESTRRVAGVIVSHGQVANELLSAAETIIGHVGHVAAVSIGWHDDVEAASNEVRRAIERVSEGGAFRSAVRLERADRSSSADAKSILSVLMLAASRGTELFIRADGDDEQDALDSLCRLISGGFGEGEE